jgi:hypothetical protein
MIALAKFINSVLKELSRKNIEPMYTRGMKNYLNQRFYQNVKSQIYERAHT